MSNKDLFKAYDLKDYPEVENVEFPKEIYIAYAVCGKQCGNREFIVDGQTQVCEYCGRQMFRTEVKKYKLTETIIIFSHANEPIELELTTLENANLSKYNLHRALLSHANLRGAIFEQGNLRSAELEYADLSDANLAGTKLMNAWLKGANLSNANMSNAMLNGADLTDANLQNANLSGANILGAKFQRALFDENTIWPEGFNPEENEAKKIETT